MYWADKLADQIITSGKYKPYWVDDMKTPSGRVHIGSVRAVLTHELIYRALGDRKMPVTFTYVFDDQDPMDSIPTYLDQEKYRQHLGKPLYKIPSPEPGYQSYGQRWSQEYIELFNATGAHPQIIWGSKLYESGKMNGVIKECLNNAAKIREIYWQLYGKNSKPKDWLPFQVECENCGKISTTVATSWDGKELAYECRENAVDWTKGCGQKGKVSPFNGHGKLPWKVEWGCKWKVIGITVEGAGKDHMTAKGSHDVAELICQKVLNYPVPFAFSHEFFLVGGHKMSSSKGIGSTAKEVSEIIPPYIIRFMIARVPFSRAINFDPTGMTIPDLFDAYDEVAAAYWDKKEDRSARIYELSQVAGAPPATHFLPRFRDVAKFLQDPKVNVAGQFVEIKGKPLTAIEKTVLDERIKYAKIWLEKYAPKEQVFAISSVLPKEVSNLSPQQKEFLSKIVDLLKNEWANPEELQQSLYQTAKDMNLPPKKAFAALYLTLLGKTHGPKAAWLLIDNIAIAKERFKKVSMN